MLFTANIYQLDKTGENNSFSLTAKGEAENLPTSKEVANYFAAKLFKTYKTQKAIEKTTGKSRFLRLAKTKPLFFNLCIDGKNIFFNESNELFEELKVKFIVGDLTEKQFAKTLQLIIDLIWDNTELS